MGGGMQAYLHTYRCAVYLSTHVWHMIVFRSKHGCHANWPGENNWSVVRELTLLGISVLTCAHIWPWDWIVPTQTGAEEFWGVRVGRNKNVSYWSNISWQNPCSCARPWSSRRVYHVISDFLLCGYSCLAAHTLFYLLPSGEALLWQIVAHSSFLTQLHRVVWAVMWQAGITGIMPLLIHASHTCKYAVDMYSLSITFNQQHPINQETCKFLYFTLSWNHQ